MIPTHNASALVNECVVHLTDASVASRIVVDDVSAEDIAGLFKDATGVHVLRVRHQRGLAHALNVGANHGSAPYILFLNNDIFAEPGAVDRLLHTFEAHPAAASAAGRLVEPATGATQASYQPRTIPGPLAVAARLLGLERAWSRNPITGQHLRSPLPEDRPVVTRRQPAGACLLVRRPDHERIGGWDERYWIWYEDVDYSRRLLDLGDAVYEPRAVFRHVGGASTGHWGKPEQHRRLYHGSLQYGAAHFGRTGQIFLGVTAVVVALPRIAAYRSRRADDAEVYRMVMRAGLGLITGAGVPSMMT